MSGWSVNEPVAKHVIETVTTDKENLQGKHTTLSDQVDAADKVFADSKVGKIKTALNGLYNRCFTHQMTNAETQVANACTKATDAVTALHNGQYKICSQLQSDAAAVNWQAPITDGKKVD